VLWGALACFGVFQSIPEQSALEPKHVALVCFGVGNTSNSDSSINNTSFFVIF